MKKKIMNQIYIIAMLKQVIVIKIHIIKRIKM